MPSTGAGVRVSFLPDSLLPIHRRPWHSYDFDFASLNPAMAHLRRPEAGFEFERADITYEDTGPPFADPGPVRVRFLHGGHFVEFELPFPAEPGYADVRFRLLSVRAVPPGQWAELRRERVSGRQLRASPHASSRRWARPQFHL